MANNIVQFRHPWQPVQGKEMLAVRRDARRIAKRVAAEAVSDAFVAVIQTPAIGELGIRQAIPVFILSMRQALRQLERQHGLMAPGEDGRHA